MIIIGIIKLLIILCIVATIHEFGHFIAAKIFKIGVSEFSIGFGPKIYQKKYHDTLYSLRWIPLGGYVMIEGEGEQSNLPTSFGNKNVFKQVTVLIMGAMFNLLLAIAILLPITMLFTTNSTVITKFSNNSVLEENGLKIGDKITKINDKKVYIIDEFFSPNNINNKITNIEYIRDNNIYNISINDAVKNIGYIGIAFNNNSLVVADLQNNMPAKKSGILVNDKIIKVDNISVNTSSQAIDIIKNKINSTVKIEVLRNNSEVIIKDVEVKEKLSFNLGISNTEEIKTTIPLAIYKTFYKVKLVVGSYVDLFKGNVKLDDVSSIVGIGAVVTKTEGIIEFLNILAIISLAIGAANLIPFPPLDGFKIVIVTIEAVIRRKISDNIQGIISMIGFVLLILLTIVITYKDILNII
ncbi:MAG: RIP metalloprotease RseP [Clostridia bacterium]